MKKHLTLALTFFLFSKIAFSGIKLDNLSQTDVNNVSKEFAANLAHTIVAPASTYGNILGFEVGIVGGVTKTPNIEKISTNLGSSAVSKLPSAGLIAGLSIPFGITGEINLIPKIGTSDVSFQNTSAGIKWTINSLLKDIPLDLALRLHGNMSTLNYSSVINNSSTGNQNINTDISWKNKTLGYNLEISKKFLFIEPYAGFGFIKANSDINISANTTVSIFTFTTANKYSASNSGTHAYAGVNFNLFLFKIGAEYSRILGVDKAMGKFSFYF